MKWNILLLMSCASFMACSTSGSSPPNENTRVVCPGVNAMIGQEISTKYEIDKKRQIAVDLNAAAAADVAQLKGLTEAKVDVGTQSQLGTTIKTVVETTSKVTTEFFQQDQSFAQAACFMNSVLASNDLSTSDRDFFLEQRRKLMSNRTEYLDVLTGLKKN